MARVSDALLHGGGDARHSWPGSTLARNPTQVTQVSNVKIYSLQKGHWYCHVFSEGILMPDQIKSEKVG